MSFDRHRSAGYLANHLARLFAQRLQAAVAPLGLAPAQFMTLLELWAGDGLTQRDLVARLDVEQATMANTLARMERDGLITRRPHPADARARQVWLTDRGRDLEQPAKAAARAVNDRALAGLDPADQGRLLDLMGRVIADLREDLSKETSSSGR